MTEYQQARDVNTTVRLLAKYYRIKSSVKKLKCKIPSPKLCAAVNAIKSHKDGECHYIDYRKSFLMEINKLSKMKRDLRHVLNRSWLHNERIMQEIAKKYELTDETIIIGDKVLHRIKALIDIPKYNVNAGDLGGFIEKEENLSHNGNCWVSDNALIYDDARVYDNARVRGNALIYGNACVFGNARVFSNVRIYDSAWIYGNALIRGSAWIYGDACVRGETRIVQGKYHVSPMHITVLPHNITAIYPNHVQVGCVLFEICDKKTAIKTMKSFDISKKYHEQIWLSVLLCKQWLKDNPEKGDKQ